MIPLNKELTGQIRHLATEEGAYAFLSLIEAVEDYYKNECVTSEGTPLYRNQGAAQLAKWLKTLPESLRKEL